MFTLRFVGLSRLFVGAREAELGGAETVARAGAGPAETSA
jgi:hypothetical protein